MRFVPGPVPSLLWSATETRAADFALFVKETRTPWIPPDAETGDDFPAANVTWDDAQAFCQWLTAREQNAGAPLGTQPGIPGGPQHTPDPQPRPASLRWRYRLPSDAEWSAAAGLPREDGNTPRARGESELRHYAWGSPWPPPAGAGNFSGEETEVDKSEPGNFIAGYRDGYAKLAPVGKFPPNRYGIHDLSGNVLEWCEDWFDARHLGRTARGGSWLNGDPDTLSLSHRAELPPRAGVNVAGFRCVLEIGK